MWGFCYQQNNVEAFLLLLGAPSSGYVGSGVAEWWFTHCNTTAHTVLSAFNVRDFRMST